MVTSEPFHVDLAPELGLQGAHGKRGRENWHKITSYWTHRMPAVFIYTNKCFQGTSTDLITFNVAKKNANSLHWWESRSRQETKQFKRLLSLWDVVSAITFIWAKKFISAQHIYAWEQVWNAYVSVLLFALEICFMVRLHPWSLGTRDKPYF